MKLVRYWSNQHVFVLARCIHLKTHALSILTMRWSSPGSRRALSSKTHFLQMKLKARYKWNGDTLLLQLVWNFFFQNLLEKFFLQFFMDWRSDGWNYNWDLPFEVIFQGFTTFWEKNIQGRREKLSTCILFLQDNVPSNKSHVLKTPFAHQICFSSTIVLLELKKVLNVFEYSSKEKMKENSCDWFVKSNYFFLNFWRS